MSGGRPIVVEADEDIFEINDFTVVTELEGFIVSLESLFQLDNSWLKQNEAEKNENFQSLYKSETKYISYGKFEFLLNYYHNKRLSSATDFQLEKENVSHLNEFAQELMNFNHDFCECSTISKQFGVSRYVVLTTATYKPQINDEDTLHTVLSAVNVALTNAGCELPVFVQMSDISRQLYHGVSLNRNLRISFEGAHLLSPLFKHKFLNGLIDMFKEKVDTPYNVDRGVKISIQLDFIYRQISPSVADEQLMGNKPEENDTNMNKCSHKFGFGAEMEPLDCMNLSVCWLNVNENALNENDSYSDLDPLSAPKWFLSFTFHDDTKHLLSFMLGELMDCRESSCANCLLFTFNPFNENKSGDAPAVASALDSIAGGGNYATGQLNFFSSSTNSGGSGGSKAKDHYSESLEGCLNHLSREFDSGGVDPALSNTFLESLQDNYFRNMKAASAVDSLSSRITKCLCAQFIRNPSGLDWFAFLWKKFVDMLRICWENNINLPGFENADENQHLDLARCLFEQKLQMLQYCVVTKRQRHKTLDSLKDIFKVANLSTNNSGRDDDDCFFDASESFEAATADSTREPHGRLHMLEQPNKKFLLHFPDRPIYVPITQDFGPMTEDMVDEYTTYLTSLEGGSDARTRAQLDILLSDMQAFKAANPGCVLEDFVRWHSPRDWIVSPSSDAENDDNIDDSKGELSDRMQLPDCIWRETWNSARPIAVAQQARIFNETKEAEKILQSFERISVRALIDLLLPVIIGNVIHDLAQKSTCCLPLVKDHLIRLCQSATFALKDLQSDDIFDIKSSVEFIEMIITRHDSLKTFFMTQLNNSRSAVDGTETDALLVQLLDDVDPLRHSETNRIKILDAPRGTIATAIHQRFAVVDGPSGNRPLSHFQHGMPTPYRKQYILRWMTPRPGVDSRLMPQRMYINVEEGASREECEFRLCGAFATDISFS